VFLACPRAGNGNPIRDVRFDIRHITTYRYSRPVRLGPHVVRLLPRTDGRQRPLAWRCTVSPVPVRQAQGLDAAGNLATYLWFAGTTACLRIDCSSCVLTAADTALTREMDAAAGTLPPAYRENELQALGASRQRGPCPPTVAALSARLAAQAGNDIPAYLAALNGFLYGGFERVIRDTGAPQDPGHTLATRRGACRDLAWLFIAACRSRGLAARFVSGYQAQPEHPGRRRYLHAWPEVYLPGGSWRGYDPTHGSCVTDAHVAVAAACEAAATLPVDGWFTGDGAHATLDFALDIRTRPAPGDDSIRGIVPAGMTERGNV
jgi:transglutaminase-like putative cysteine protease